MKLTYTCPAVRQRLTDFLGSDCIEHATAAYLTRSDGCQFSQRELATPSEIDALLEQDLDVARSLADSESFLLHLDVEYVNFDSPAEAFTDPWRTFNLQEPVVKVIESLLLQWGIRPLHIITGQGHHFVWRVRRTSPVARRILSLTPAPELVDACMARVPPLLIGRIDEESQRVFSAIALIIEFVAHRIKEDAAPLCALPVEVTAVHVGPGSTQRREIVSIDTSEYGDPLHTRMIRMPFTRYLKPWVNGMAHSLGLDGEIPEISSIPLHEMDIRQAIKIRQVDEEVCDLAQRACVRIPLEEPGTERLVDHYMSSRLRRFHEYYYSTQHDKKQDWHQTYDRTPLISLPACARNVLEWPNDLLLKPAGIQLITRCLLAEGWHPRHIAGLIRSKFENPAFGWGVNWLDYEAGTRADFYTRLFAGLHLCGLDRLVDFNCTSTHEKGFCFFLSEGTCNLDHMRQNLLLRIPDDHPTIRLLKTL